MVLRLRLVVMVLLVVLVVMTPMLAVVNIRVRVSAVMVVVCKVVRAGSMIMRGVSPVQLVFPLYLLQALPRLFRR